MAKNTKRSRAGHTGRAQQSRIVFQTLRWTPLDFADDCTGIQDEELIAAARRGDTEAQYRLGKLYSAGKDVPRDDARALYWFQRAVQPPIPGQEPLYKISYPCTEQVPPHKEAAYEVGRAIFHGRGADLDTRDASEWWKLADMLGSEHAHMALCAYHIPDNPKTMDDTTFIRMVQMAEAGDMDIQYCLGNCFYMGWYVDQEYVQALEWWKKAAEQGHELALHNAGGALLEEGIPERRAEAVSLLEKAVSLGLRKSKVLLGRMYLHGEFVQADPAKGVDDLSQAVEEGSVDARTILGAALVLGTNGVPKNRELGMAYLQEAALENGNPHAREVLTRILLTEKMEREMSTPRSARKKSARKRTQKRKK